MEPNQIDVYSHAANTGYAYTVISNNFKHIHLNVIGQRFDRIHELCDEYYQYFSKKADFFFELALQNLDSIDNPMNATMYSDIGVLEERNYNYRDAGTCMSAQFQSAIDAVCLLRDSAVSMADTAIQSDCDAELSYLNKQLNFFMRKRLDSVY